MDDNISPFSDHWVSYPVGTHNTLPPNSHPKAQRGASCTFNNIMAGVTFWKLWQFLALHRTGDASPQKKLFSSKTLRWHHLPCRRGSGSSAAWSYLTRSICLPYTSSPLSLHPRWQSETDRAPVCKHKWTVGTLILRNTWTTVVSIKIDVDFCLAEGEKEGHKLMRATTMRNTKFS